MTFAGAQCRHCGQPLTPVQQHGSGICGGTGCRHLENRLRTGAIQASAGEAALAAAGSLIAGRPVSVLWLQPTETDLVPVPEQRRARHRDHLDGLVERHAAGEAAAPLAPAEPDGAGSSHEHHLCAQCAGRCCQLGATSNAFTTLPQLLRWQQAHPTASIGEAADWFMAQILETHVRNSCVYHGARGCTLPREHRADICNAYACAPLHQMRAGIVADAGTAFVTLTHDGERLVRSAVVDAEGIAPLVVK